MASLIERYAVISDERNIIDRSIPKEIEENLNPKLPLREYQREAIGRFIHYLVKDQRRLRPTQLLFHMATGSGKTLLMASNILYLYTLGYRNFLFFVNSTNIIRKTKENFLNFASSKYLFNEKIHLNGKCVIVKEISNFDEASQDAINIVFTTIQGLHSVLNTPRENSLTYEEFESRKIVIISDEAHHINAWTRKGLGKEEKIEKQTWEQTVSAIFNKNYENIMLEYTATIDTGNPAIKEKYENKILFEYTLRDFRRDGYSKEVKVLQADLEPVDRALQAIILSQYRRKVAEKNHLNIKPVLLLKSKTIAASEEFSKNFSLKIKELKESDIEKLKRHAKTGILSKAFSYFEKEEIPLSNLVFELKEDFSEEKCISINSQSDSEENQLLVNSLEETDNQIRLVFAVDKLNEGWDVLNLYDIVRLYETRDSANNLPGKTTLAEAQLIGRGARYCPFTLEPQQDRFKRKYDDLLEDDKRILEELCYHSSHNPRYIQELSVALKNTGIMPSVEAKTIQVKIKDLIKKTSFWSDGVILLNERIRVDRSKIKNLTDIDIQKVYRHAFQTGEVQDLTVFETAMPVAQERRTKVFKLKEFNAVLRKAFDRLEFYRFETIKLLFPHISAMSEFSEWLSDIEVEITSSPEKLDEFSQDEKLEVTLSILSSLQTQIQKEHTEFKGSKRFKNFRVKDKVQDKLITIDMEANSDRERGVPMSQTTNDTYRLDISSKDWYVYDENYGTSEEKSFIRFVNDSIEKLRRRFSNVYLLRNESLFKIYRFSDGKAMEPDFVLFLREGMNERWLCYQLFIEPKGAFLVLKDAWKQDFLKEIESAFKVETLSEDAKFRLIGLPFYTEEDRGVFREGFNKALHIGN